jgi:hypothetical protein
MNMWSREAGGVVEKAREHWLKKEHLFRYFGGNSIFCHIALNGVPLLTCSDFRYLGLQVQNDDEIIRDMKNRINAGTFFKLKGNIYKTIIRPVVWYGLECLAAKVRNGRRMYVREYKY